MGTALTRLSEFDTQIPQSTVDAAPFIDSGDDMSDNPISDLTEDVLIEILSHVPASDLIFNCRLVCKRWQYLIDAQSIWRRKCERENIKLPTRKLPQLPNHHYRYIYFHSISKTKNLLKNPCGESKTQHWDSDRHNFFEFENPPAGADPVPEEVGSQSCFATTYMNCEKHQRVDLIKSTVNKYLLHNDLVKIKVGEWYAARFDCASEYELKVTVYDEHSSVIDSFHFEFVEEQWHGKEWHLVTHEFDDVTNACYVTFEDRGKDRQFWAGYYGSKMTGGFVELCIK